MARDWVHWNNNRTTFLPIDEMMIGQIRTRSSDSYVPDSASTATAYSCGIKVYNGAIAVDDDSEPCGTVLEAAKLEGFKTGLIVTSRITHVCHGCLPLLQPGLYIFSVLTPYLIGYSCLLCCAHLRP